MERIDYMFVHGRIKDAWYEEGCFKTGVHILTDCGHYFIGKEQDCCELFELLNTEAVDDIKQLKGFYIEAYVSSSEDGCNYDGNSEHWEFVVICGISLRFYGAGNGYYSIAPECYIIEEEV